MKKTLLLALITINGAALFICGLALFLFVVNILTDQAQKRGYADIEQIRQDLETEHPSTEILYQAVALQQSELISAHIIIVDMDSNLLADSQVTGDFIPGKFINAAIMEARGTNLGGDILRNIQSGMLTVSTARKVQVGDSHVIIALSYNLDEERKLLFFFGGFISLLMVLFITLAAMVINYTLKRYRSPIKKLIHHTREAARGGFNKIYIDSVDGELKELTDEFNALVNRYNFLIEEDNSKYSRINTMLANLHTGILMVDNNLEVTLVNPEAEKLLRLNKLSLFGIRGTESRENGSLSEILGRISRFEDRTSTGNFILEKDSGLVLEIEIEVMKNKYDPYEKTGYLIILRDITEMRKMEKLKDEFVANVSHELRTPLTVISGFVETLKSYESLDREDRAMALNIIEVETERLKKLIGELLLLSKIEGEMGKAQKRDIDVLDAVETVKKTLEPVARERKIQSEFDFQEELPNLYGVQGWFRQIVYNLYDNAIKYSPDNSSIIVRLYTHGENLCLEVEDRGPGIPADERDLIFDRFYRRTNRGKEEPTGNGIGLTITRHMVSEFGGEIRVDEGSEKGARFRVTIPLNQRESR